ncbi:type IV pili twitching motility protein PilT, partial [Klebsiella pneumoniae]|nr:type IV pili twitching motility protein PilT [Klebsiella pneumoniae]
MEIFSFLNVMVEKGGSDLFFSVGAPVNLKIEGVTHPLKMPVLLPGQVKQLAYSVMNEKQISEFEAKQEMNLSISAENLG